MTSAPTLPMASRRQSLTEQRWRYMSGLAGKWRTIHLPDPIPPSELDGIAARRAVYVPLRERLVPTRALIVDYVGSVSRTGRNAVWRRVVSEHQTQHLERLLDWDYVAVIPLRDDTPTQAVRLIEAAVAATAGRPPKCVRLPRLPDDWRAELRRTQPVRIE